MPFCHCLGQTLCLMNLLNIYQALVLILHEVIYWKRCPGQRFAKVLPFIVVWLDIRLTREVKGAETYHGCLKTRVFCSLKQAKLAGNLASGHMQVLKYI